MGGEHRTLGILPHSSGFPKGLETPDYPTWWEFFLFYSFGDDCHLPATEREVWESSRLLSLMPWLPHCHWFAHCFFVLEKTPFPLLPAIFPSQTLQARFTPTGLRTPPHQGSLANQSAPPSAHEEGSSMYFSHCYPLILPHLVPLTLSLRLASLNR